jgi:D-lactate dehydrogenase (cytochrome)
MPAHRAHARPPRGTPTAAVQTDPDLLGGLLEDAAHFPGGHAAGVVFVEHEADIAAALQRAPAVLPIGAQSSLTGAATPRGELLLSTARQARVIELGSDFVRIQPGVPLVSLAATLAAHGRRYPPVPTYDGAFIGGTVATNAAGAATFKYGSTRDWVQALTIVLACGEVLDLTRGSSRIRTASSRSRPGHAA